MKQYFSFNLRSERFVAPLLGAWFVFVVAVVLIALFGIDTVDESMTLVNGRWLLEMLCSALLQYALWVAALMFVLRPVVQHTIGAIMFDETPCEFNLDKQRYVREVLVGVALSVLTFGIYAPWFVVRLIKTFADAASYKFDLFTFKGKGMTLFAVIVLTSVLPVAVIALVSMSLGLDQAVEPIDMMSFAPLWGLLLSIVELFFVALSMVLVYRWVLDATCGSKVVTTRMMPLSATGFIMWQIILSIITFGLYAPMAELRIFRYVAEHTYLVGPDSESRYGVTIRAWRDWGWLWLQLLLLLVTLGVYMPWYYTKIVNRFGSRLFIEQ